MRSATRSTSPVRCGGINAAHRRASFIATSSRKRDHHGRRPREGADFGSPNCADPRRRRHRPKLRLAWPWGPRLHGPEQLLGAEVTPAPMSFESESCCTRWLRGEAVRWRATATDVFQSILTKTPRPLRELRPMSPRARSDHLEVAREECRRALSRCRRGAITAAKHLECGGQAAAVAIAKETKPRDPIALALAI